MGYSVPSKLTSQTPTSINSANNLNQNLQDINKSIETICERLNRIEERLDEQDKAIQQVQQFEANVHSNMEKLTSIIQKLGDHINYIAPRRLDHSFSQMEPKKQQDTRSSPGKGIQS